MSIIDEPCTLVTIAPNERGLSLWQAAIPKVPKNDLTLIDERNSNFSASATSDVSILDDVDKAGAQSEENKHNEEDEDSVEISSTGVRSIKAAQAARTEVAVRQKLLGLKLGQLDCKKQRALKGWCMPKLKHQQHVFGIKEATELLKTDYFEMDQFSNENGRQKQKLVYQDLMSAVAQSQGKFEKEGRVTKAPSAREKRRGEMRRSIMGQMYGLRTWKETEMEASWYDTLEEEKSNQQKHLNRRFQQREMMMKNASKEAREVAQYSELLNTDVETMNMVRPTLRSSLPVPWLPATDSENWGINSINRQQRMYANLFDTDRHKKQCRKKMLNKNQSKKVKKKKNHRGRPGAATTKHTPHNALSLNQKIHWQPSQFLEQQMDKREQLRKDIRMQDRARRAKSRGNSLKNETKILKAHSSTSDEQNNIIDKKSNPMSILGEIAAPSKSTPTSVSGKVVHETSKSGDHTPHAHSSGPVDSIDELAQTQQAR